MNPMQEETNAAPEATTTDAAQPEQQALSEITVSVPTEASSEPRAGDPTPEPVQDEADGPSE